MDRFGSIESTGDVGNCKEFGMVGGKVFEEVGRDEVGEGMWELDYGGLVWRNLVFILWRMLIKGREGGVRRIRLVVFVIDWED